ncbi:5274_t:CDS:10 [Paraglomus occultum]|uniref:Eukaryotic translation initiation factor 3 subunit L n=1 Tax=Paraglomus occultum TaxID=144539 RepID=A0A9N8VC12_9GLOM|nr:5274_t:CDS:10 [Paraglomus occultum]
MFEAYEEDVDLEIDLVVANNPYAAVNDDMLDEAMHQQQQYAQEVEIPDVVRNFIVYFHRNILENNVYELHGIYENSFNRLTEHYYPKSPWPEADYIVPLVDNDQVFLTLYRELYFRHIYSKLTPTIEHRFASYENYCDLFNYILNSDGPVGLELPNQWLWDIIDEFIYQFQSFCNYRNRLRTKTEEEIALLRDNIQVWSCYSVLNVLYSLITKSRIMEQLVASKNGGDMTEAAGEYGSRPLYKMLGYFSIIGLLRVHCLLGDYTLALKMMDNIELNKKALFARVTACHVTTYYYVGFAYMMMRRYADAIRAFSHILVFITRTKMYHTRSYQFDQINKKGDQMYALLAICIALCPTRLDDNVHTLLREKYGDQLSKMQKGEEALPVFEDLFLYACPKFISPNGPNFEDPSSWLLTIEPPHHHARIFQDEVKNQIHMATIRSFLKLYTTMGIDKLAKFLEMEPEELRTQLLIFKQKSRQQKWVSGTLLEGEYVTTSDLDFCLKEDMVHIAESKVGRRHGDWFLRNINKCQDILASLEARS